MSEEKPRRSRRELREKGLLKPVTEGTSPIEELTRTQELNLHRLSRKEMRERETASRSAVDAEVEAAKKVAAERLRAQKEAEGAARKAAADRAAAEAAARAAAEREKAAQEKARQERAAEAAHEAEAERAQAERERIAAEEAAATAAEQERMARERAEQEKEAQGADARKSEEGRRSVFERFVKASDEDGVAGVVAGAGAGESRDALTSSDATDAPDTSDSLDAATEASGSDSVRDEYEDADEDSFSGSLQDRLLARVREDGFSSASGASAASADDTGDASGDEAEFEELLRGEVARTETASEAANPDDAATGDDSPAQPAVGDGENDVLSKIDGEDSSLVLEAEYGVAALQEEKPRGVLMTVIGVLIGLLAGLLLGLGIRAMLSNSDGDIEPEVTVAVVQTWNPVLEENSDCI